MKTKQAYMKAIFCGEEKSNAKNLANEKETISQYIIVDKKTEKEVINCRVYMGRSSSSSQVYASIWISNNGLYTSGYGTAGGYGYHKESAAIDYAISSAGFELFGNVYVRSNEKPDFKKQCHIGGVGESAIDSALLAIAYSIGVKDCIFVKA